MTFDYSLAALVAAGPLLCLIFALLRPERFWRPKSPPNGVTCVIIGASAALLATKILVGPGQQSIAPAMSGD